MHRDKKHLYSITSLALPASTPASGHSVAPSSCGQANERGRTSSHGNRQSRRDAVRIDEIELDSIGKEAVPPQPFLWNAAVVSEVQKLSLTDPSTAELSSPTPND